MRHRSVFLAALLASTPALAQGDPSAMARQSAANQLGALQFCQTRGDVGADVVSAEREVIATLPPSTAPTDAAEALGKQGTIATPNGQQVTFADMATRQNTTVAALCKQMGSSTLQAAAAFKQNGLGTGRLPTMPAMPSGMTAIPGLPNGMPNGMPNGIPGMPAMPSPSGLTAVPGLPPAPGVPGR